MSGASSVNLLTILLFNFLPGFTAKYVQDFYYRLITPAGSPMPGPGSTRYARDNRFIRILIIIGFFFFNIYEANWELRNQGDFYSLLDLPMSADEKTVQSKFRKLTVLFHPDKLKDLNSDQQEAAQRYFIHLKVARDILSDTSKRFAYERFGPTMLEWKECITKYDFLSRGFWPIVGYYISVYGGILFTAFMGYHENMRYWQYFITTATFVFELHTIARPDRPMFASHIINPLLHLIGHPGYLPYQVIQIIRRATVSGLLAATFASQLIASPESTLLADKPQDQQQALNQLVRIAQELDADAQRLLYHESSSFIGNEEFENKAKESLVTWLVQNEIRNQPEVQRAIANTIQRRNQEMAQNS